MIRALVNKGSNSLRRRLLIPLTTSTITDHVTSNRIISCTLYYRRQVHGFVNSTTDRKNSYQDRNFLQFIAQFQHLERYTPDKLDLETYIKRLEALLLQPESDARSASRALHLLARISKVSSFHANETRRLILQGKTSNYSNMSFSTSVSNHIDVNTQEKFSTIINDTVHNPTNEKEAHHMDNRNLTNMADNLNHTNYNRYPHNHHHHQRHPQGMQEQFDLQSPEKKSIFDVLISLLDFHCLGSKELSNVIWSLSRLKLRLPKNLQDEWIKCALVSLESGKFVSQTLANVIYALARLRLFPGYDFMFSWYDESSRRMNEFNGQELSMSIYAIAKLKQKPPSFFIEAWAREYVLKIDEMEPQSLSNALWALGIMKVKISPDFLSTWTRKSYGLLQTFSPQSLSNSLQAFTLLSYDPPPEFLTVWTTHAKEAVTKFNWLEIASIINSIAKLNLSVSFDFLKSCFQEIELKLEDVEPHALCNILHGAAKLSYTPSESFLEKYFAHATKVIDGYTTQGLSITVYSIAKLQLSFEGEFRMAWYRNVNEKFDLLGPQTLSIMLFGLAGIKTEIPDEKFMANLLKRLKLAMEEKSFHGQNLSNIIFSLHVLDLRGCKSAGPDVDFINKWLENIAHCAEQININGMHGCLNALAHFGFTEQRSVLAKHMVEFDQEKKDSI